MTDTTFADEADELALLGRELDATKAMQNTTARAEAVERIKVGVLIDIAASLRILSTGYAELAPTLEPEPREDERGEDDEPDPNVNVGPLDIDDWVAIIDAIAEHEADPENVDPATPGVIVSMGQSEGLDYALVSFVDNDEPVKVWLDFLTRVPAPELAEADEDDDDERQQLIDELDGDFDGDRHPAAEGSVDVLRQLEAKPGKSGKAKSKSKGGE